MHLTSGQAGAHHAAVFFRLPGCRCCKPAGRPAPGQPGQPGQKLRLETDRFIQPARIKIPANIRFCAGSRRYSNKAHPAESGRTGPLSGGGCGAFTPLESDKLRCQAQLLEIGGHARRRGLRSPRQSSCPGLACLASSAVLPPGAAQASSTRMPGSAPSRIAAWATAGSAARSQPLSYGQVRHGYAPV